MNGHDDIRAIEEFLVSKEFVEKVSPKFSELSSDLNELFRRGNDSVTIAVLLFKLVEERQKTNQLLQNLLGKFEEIIKKIEPTSLNQHNPIRQRVETALVLPEQDQLILHLVQEKGQVTAEEIKKELGYKGTNAASQRLNKLFKEGHLSKIQAGKKVLFLAKNQN